MKRTYKTCCNLVKLINKDNLFCIDVHNKLELQNKSPGLEHNKGIMASLSSVGKESTCNAGDPSLIPGSGRSTGEGIDYPLQYSGLENSMDHSPWGRKELDTTEQLSLTHSRALYPFFYSHHKPAVIWPIATPAAKR